MGREVGGGFMFGNACKPVVDSCQCMAKSIQYCKVKIKIKKKEGLIHITWRKCRVVVTAKVHMHGERLDVCL